MKKYLIYILVLTLTACTLPGNPSPAITQAAATPTIEVSTNTASPSETPIPSLTPTLTFTPLPTATSTTTPIPIVESLDATVTADLLSCRYGPGAEYLYLYGLKKGANIKLIGRTNGNSWVMVAGKSKCWVNTKFIEVKGDPKTLMIAYPGGYDLPVSPYYAAPIVLSATRDTNDPNKITVKWSEIALRPGDEEDDSMFIYIIEVWRCEGGQIIFDPLASNYPEVTFVDESGCDEPSRGRVFFQEKHGFAGPSEILWP